MASTRTRNMPGDYRLEQLQMSRQFDENVYIHQSSARAYTHGLPAMGPGPSRMPNDTLTTNPIDVESALRGTGMTNLSQPSHSTRLAPSFRFNPLPEFKFFDRLPAIEQRPVEASYGERHHPIGRGF